MFFSSWAKRLLVLATISAASVSAISAPVTVDFDSTSFFGFVGPSQIDPSYIESGFSFTPSGSDAMVDISFCSLGAESCISNNSTAYLTAFNGAEVTITAASAFSVSSFDASFFPLPTPEGLFSGLNFGLKLTGELWSGGPVVEQIIALVEDIARNGDFIFSSYIGDASLSNLRSLSLSACFFDGANCVRTGNALVSAGLLNNDLQFAIDNLTFDNAAAVPEPGVLWLLLISLGAFAVARRRHVL